MQQPSAHIFLPDITKLFLKHKRTSLGTTNSNHPKSQLHKQDHYIPWNMRACFSRQKFSGRSTDPCTSWQIHHSQNCIKPHTVINKQQSDSTFHVNHTQISYLLIGLYRDVFLEQFEFHRVCYIKIHSGPEHVPQSVNLTNRIVTKKYIFQNQENEQECTYNGMVDLHAVLRSGGPQRIHDEYLLAGAMDCITPPVPSIHGGDKQLEGNEMKCQHNKQ